MRELVAPITHLALSHTIAAARPDTAGTGGIDCSTWRAGGFGFPRVSITIDADAARTLADPTNGTAGVEVWGQEGGQWSFVAALNGGADIPVAGDAQGWLVVLDLGRPFDRLAVTGTPSGGTITARFTPLEVQR